MKVTKYREKFIVFFIILLLVVILYFLYKYLLNKKIIENFNEDSTEMALTSPSIKKWMFNDSKSWYTIKQNGFSKTMKDMDITANNANLSIAFLLNITSIYGGWRNIFHFSNDNDGSRIPAMWIHGGQTRFHIRFATNANTNDGIDTNLQYNITPNTPFLITLVFKGNNFKYYLNDKEIDNYTPGSIQTRSDSTKLYISDPWYNSEGIQIKNFTVYDGALTQSDITNIYTLLNNSVKNVAGPPGPAGPAGPAGRDGKDGAKGIQGNIGPMGPLGPQGIQGNIGPIGLDGPQGIQGNIGPIGLDGPQGIQGNVGPIGPVGPKGVDGYNGYNTVGSIYGSTLT